MKINWRIRMRNPVFWGQMILAVMVPVMSYMGLTVQELTTYQKLSEVIQAAISNPYVLGLTAVSVFNALQDPTTRGLSDSANAMTYEKPR